MSSTLKLEGKLFGGAMLFLTLCFGMTVYAVYKYGIDLPTCINNVEAFTKSEVIERAPKHYEIHYVARMWAFEPAVINVPPGSTLDIYLNSVDVTHGFQIAGTNANLMAVPGAVNYTQLTLNKVGEYKIVCHEYCGLSHHNMMATINVTENAAAANAAMESAQLAPSADEAEGAKLLESKACLSCHTINGSPLVGPTFKGVVGKEETLEDGSKVTVDDAYLAESIREPQLKLVKGFPPVMPKIPVTDEEIRKMIAYIKSLK
ncbi:MAG: c-type cytochrome [Pseudobdellovibrionaceae bacterium]